MCSRFVSSSDDHAFPEKAHCLGCPEDINENSEDLKVPLSVSVSKYNSISDSTHLFNLHFVGHATRQVVAGFRFKVSFDMRKTTCAKTEHKELNELCLPDDENVVFAHCNSTVDVAPWRHELPVANIKCEPGALPQLNTRRRPPGWSPLRNFIRPTPLPSQPSAVDPTKKESSEEDETGTKSPPGVASVAGAADAAIDSPFHCPSKPWKPFHPVLSALPVAPVNATVKVASPPPSGDGAFSDIDLVG
uniref:kininogen-1 n=1 Tax=Monopterus albus TaxID=43700 RepID=UPI0009B46BEE|nr:kininogen-1-like [Monopterus albus]